MHERKRLCLAEYDYSKEGAYFVTICVQGSRCVFWKIKKGQDEIHLALPSDSLMDDLPSVDIQNIAFQKKDVNSQIAGAMIT